MIPKRRKTKTLDKCLYFASLQTKQKETKSTTKPQKTQQEKAILSDHHFS